MGELEETQIIERYETDVRKAAHLYYRMWPWNRKYCDLDDLLQAGRIAVWNVFESHPDKIDIVRYVRAAIRYGIFGVLKNQTPRKREVHLVGQGDEEVPLVDLLPAHENGVQEIEDLEGICHNISRNFSDKEADSLKILVEKRGVRLFDLDLTHLPRTELKDRIGVVTAMDLSDEEMVVYANVLVGARKKFPMNYVQGRRDRAKKYIRFLLNHLKISPQEFAEASVPREDILREYRLISFLVSVYGYRTGDLVRDIFSDIPWNEIRYKGKWEGPQGLLNAYHFLHDLAKKLGKQPLDLRRRDIKRAGLSGMFESLFDNSCILAIEFSWPGTYTKNKGRATRRGNGCYGPKNGGSYPPDYYVEVLQRRGLIDCRALERRV
ncbi:MAG: hypothetical protein AABW87_02780, partial [Nanoarchaeota archaeon]